MTAVWPSKASTRLRAAYGEAARAYGGRRALFADVSGSSHRENGYTPRERVNLRPALDVKGLWGDYTGRRQVRAVRGRRQAHVHVVEGRPESGGRSAASVPMLPCPGCTLEVIAIDNGARIEPGPRPSLVRSAEAVLARESGQQAIHVRLGATVPITAIFKQTLGIDTLMFGYNLPEEDVHAPNEFFRLKSIQEGASAWTQLLAELGLRTRVFPPNGAVGVGTALSIGRAHHPRCARGRAGGGSSANASSGTLESLHWRPCSLTAATPSPFKPQLSCRPPASTRRHRT